MRTNSRFVFILTSTAPAASLTEEIEIIYISYSCPSTLSGNYASQNIELGFDILCISNGITQLFNFKLIFK